MKQFKKLFAMILAVLMLVSVISACGVAPAAPAADGSADEQAEAEEEAGAEEGEAGELSAYDQAIADRKAKAEETGEYTKVTHLIFTWTGEPAGMKRVQDAMNEILREKLGLEVELTMMDAASYRQNVRLMLTSGEEQVDWFSSTMLGYSGLVNDEYLLDLEENDLLQTYGPGILQTLKQEYLDACRFGGVLYGLPPVKDYAYRAGCVMIDKEALDAIGYEYEEVNQEVQSSWDEVEHIFELLLEKFPDKYPYAIIANQLSQHIFMDGIGGDMYGVLVEPDKSLEVVNAFESDQFREICERMYRWNQKGFISKDALSDDTAASARIRSGQYLAYISQSKPGYKTQVMAECGKEMILFICGDDCIKSTGCNNTLHSLSQACEDPVAAMQYMNALYTDEELSNLIVWGQEGTDYVLTDDGHITFPEGVDGNNAEYYHSMNWELPNSYIAHSWVGDPLDLGAKIMEFNDGARKSLALGFTFDNSDLVTEYTALQNVYDEYAKTLLFGFVDPDDPEKGIDAFNEALYAVGLQKYMDAKAEALAAWAEENGK